MAGHPNRLASRAAEADTVVTKVFIVSQRFDDAAIDFYVNSSIFDEIQTVSDVVLTINVTSSRVLPFNYFVYRVFNELRRKVAKETVLIHNFSNTKPILIIDEQLVMNVLPVLIVSLLV